MRNLKMESNLLLEVYKSLFDYHDDACFALDLEGHFILFNRTAAELTGYSIEEALQMSFIPLIPDQYLEDTLSNFNRVIDVNSNNFNVLIKHKNGRIINIYCTSNPIYIDGKLAGLVGMVKDIPDNNDFKALLARQNTVLELIAKGYPFTAVLDSINYLIEDFSNGGFCSIMLVDKSGDKLVTGSAPNLSEEFIKSINRTPIGPDRGSCGTAAYYKCPIVVENIETDSLWIDFRDVALRNRLRSCWSAPVFDNQKNIIAVFAIYHDKPWYPKKEDLQLIEKATYLTSLVIQHYRNEEKINYMAYHDELTGLPNRRLFQENVENTITVYSNSPGKNFGLLFLDLDRFKIVNDTLGHRIGDKLLKDVAIRLQRCLRKGDIASRQGGDEFAILLRDVSKIEATRLAQSIIEVLSVPILIDQNEIFITPSIGISLYPFDGISLDELLRKADVAMYHAKKEGRNNFQFYYDTLDRKTYENLEIENELRKALDKDQFKLLYQPIINLSTNKMSGVEALIRWNHPKLGIVSPDKFISIAEETGMIVPIGEWVLKTASRQLMIWEQEGLFPETVSVNISLRQFYQSNLIPMTMQVLNEAGIEYNRLTVEITESMTMDVQSATSILHDIKKLGVKIAMDDFGTGYSSLSHLKLFPIDYLKIDKSFIQDITRSNGDKNIAITILLMAHNLGLRVIAEGVETKEQLEILRKYNCDEAQGYYFSKPLSANDLALFLEKQIFSYN